MKTFNEQLAGLTVLHRPKDAAGRGMALAMAEQLQESGFYAATCLRELAVAITIDDASGWTALAAADAEISLLRGAQAYRLLLETVTGLNSSVPGETNVQGQIRRVWDTWRHGASADSLQRMDPFMHRLFADARRIRARHLNGIGGNSYASLARKLLEPDSDARILFVGAGELAQSMFALFAAYDTAVWNRHAVCIIGDQALRCFAPDEAVAAAAWATHVIITTPPDNDNDRRWAQLTAGRGKELRILHLGCRRAQRGAWRNRNNVFDLDDVFDLRSTQSERRKRSIGEAREACARLAGRDVLRLGTRGSLLALAQSRIVARQLEEAHPGLQVELVEYATRGDHDRATPLTDVSDNRFFSDGLDAALAAGEIDFCVHSWKDIDGPRPQEFVRAAVPARALPHDVIVFRADVTEKLANGEVLRIGTSSTRRAINTADFLEWALPHRGHKPRFEFRPLRGPVHERVRRLTAAPGDDDGPGTALDGIVLALAGLERLWSEPAGRAALAPHLRDARWMVMPLSECPAAPAQAAMAVETRRDNLVCRRLLAAIHHPDTEQLVTLEQALVAEHDPDGTGGFGATAVSEPTLGFVARLRGRPAGDQPPVYVTRTATDTERPQRNAAPWPGKAWRDGTRKQRLPVDREALCSAPAIFLAHADALAGNALPDTARCWTSGSQSWAQLARQGVWIEGCADNLGFDAARELLASPVLRLPLLSDWVVTTHRDAVEGWDGSGIGHVIATYRIDIALNHVVAREELARCTHYYWSSARQYRALRDWLPANAQHACGTGKTLRALRAAGLDEVRAFASRREWQAWLG